MRIVPNLWFDSQAEEAAAFYCSIFPDSEVVRVDRYTEAGPGPAGSVVTVEFRLGDQTFIGLNGGPAFTFDEAVSFAIECDDQEQADHYWTRLTEGGEESQCGWLKDKYGLSWQVYPAELIDLTFDPDPARAARATKAMLGMKKIDIEAVRAAADGG